MEQLRPCAWASVRACKHATGFLRHAAAGLRAQGRLGLLAQKLTSLAFCPVHTVEWGTGSPVFARDSFTAFGVEPWCERARQALRSAGEGGKRQSHTDWDLLAPQELQIAQVAVEGLSDKETGRQLHLSVRTIGAHPGPHLPEARDHPWRCSSSRP